MATSVPKISARFETTLASSMAKGATSFTLTSGTDKAGNALSGLYGFVIDNGTATEEFVIGSVAGTAVTSVASGLDPANPQTTVTTLQQTHRKGASVKITDYPILAYLREMLNGNTAFTLDNVLKYTAEPTFNDRKQLADKGYADDIIVGAVPTASTSVAGTVKISTASGTPTAVETGDPRVPTSSQALALPSTTAPSGTNKYISQSDLQKAAENYIASSGSANAYVVAYTPAVAALAAGLRLTFLANFANTGAATLAVNGLTAKTIKKVDGATDLVANDIKNGQLVEVEYDGTNFQMLSQVGNAIPTAPVYKNGIATHDVSVTGAQTIAHGLGATPKYIRLTVQVTGTANGIAAQSFGVYNGTTSSSTSVNGATGTVTSDTSNAVAVAGISGTSSKQASAIVTFDGTNITLTWSNGGTPTGTAVILWEAIA